jgi:hypothetical protein
MQTIFQKEMQTIQLIFWLKQESNTCLQTKPETKIVHFLNHSTKWTSMGKILLILKANPTSSSVLFLKCWWPVRYCSTMQILYLHGFKSVILIYQKTFYSLKGQIYYYKLQDMEVFFNYCCSINQFFYRLYTIDECIIHSIYNETNNQVFEFQWWYLFSSIRPLSHYIPE